MNFHELSYVLYIRHWNVDGDVATLPNYKEFRRKLLRDFTIDELTEELESRDRQLKGYRAAIKLEGKEDD